MASYDEWNSAILHYLIDGVPIGSRVFLAIDEEALMRIANLLEEPPPTPQRVDDFIQAIRQRCVAFEGQSVKRFKPDFSDVRSNPPPYLAFLAATVLAAYRMGEDEEVSANNYFDRLDEMLGLPETIHGRPAGLEHEDLLWRHWARWLDYRGFLPSAQAGSGAHKYIRYPISQTFLRETDKDALWRHFTMRNWSRHLDERAVSARIIQDRQYLTRHIERFLSSEYIVQRDGILQAIYDVYDIWTSSEQDKPYRERTYAINRNMQTGLYREFDVFTNQPEYLLFPRRPRRMREQSLSIRHQGVEYPLNIERSGWYEPLWQLSSDDLAYGLCQNIEGSEEIQKLILPSRDFWILVPDPDDPESGIYASWGKPELGIPFVVLCQSSLQNELQSLHDEGVLEWRAGDPISVWDHADWVEYRDVMVVSQGWTGLSIQHEELYQALQPQITLGVSFRGGIRLSQESGWVVGHGPQIIIHSFYPEAELTIIEPISGKEIGFQEKITTNHPISIDWPDSIGSYLLVFNSGGDTKESSIRFLDWQSSPVALCPPSKPLKIGNGAVFGAVVQSEMLPDLGG